MMTNETKLGGTFAFPGTSSGLYRMGYGAMQLAGPEIFGPPRDVDAAIAVLREAIASGVNHIDTSDYYGPHVTNQIIKKALHPYPAGLVIVTKLGARRGEDKSWIPALSRKELIDGLHDNLRNLGLDHLDVVNLRVGGMLEPSEGSIAEPLGVLVELKRQGLIRHIGLSNVSPKQLQEAQRMRSSASKISTMWPTAMTMPSSMLSRNKASLTCHSSPWEASRHCSQPCSIRSRPPCKPRLCRSRLPGFFSVLPTFC